MITDVECGGGGGIKRRFWLTKRPRVVRCSRQAVRLIFAVLLLQHLLVHLFPFDPTQLDFSISIRPKHAALVSLVYYGTALLFYNLSPAVIALHSVCTSTIGGAMPTQPSVFNKQVHQTKSTNRHPAPHLCLPPRGTIRTKKGPLHLLVVMSHECTEHGQAKGMSLWLNGEAGGLRGWVDRLVRPSLPSAPFPPCPHPFGWSCQPAALLLRDCFVGAMPVTPWHPTSSPRKAARWTFEGLGLNL